MVKVELATAVIGFGLLVTGLARLSVSAALIVAGALLLVGAVWNVRRPE